MKMKTTKCLFLAAAALTLTACSNDDENLNGGPVAAQVTAGIGGVQTRASGTTWDSGDAIGISTIGSTLTSYANMKYTTSGDGNFTHAADLGGEDSGMFFQDADETVTFRAYYPFHGNEYTDAGTISDVTTDGQTMQSTFDFLFATGATASKSSPTVSFNNTVKENTSFTHRMSRLVLNFIAGPDVNLADLSKYTLSGLSMTGSFNTATGEAKATGTASDLTMDAAYITSSSSSLILIPQAVADAVLKVELGGQNYTATLTFPKANAVQGLESGYSYKYNVTIYKEELNITEANIEPWVDASVENDGNVDATI